MSYAYSKAVYWYVPDNTDATSQSVLAALAFCHNQETGRCDPSIPTLAKMTHLGETAVKSSRKKLRDLGYIRWETHCDGTDAKNTSCKYFFSLPSERPQSPAASSPVAASPLPQSPDDPMRGRHAPPKRNMKYNINPNINKVMSGLVGESFDDAAKPRSLQEPPEVDAGAVDAGAVDAVWEAYPRCRYKTSAAKTRFRALYAQLRAKSDDGGAFDAKMLASLKEWRKSDQWTKSGGMFIPAPINFLLRGLWESEVEPSEQEEPAPLPNLPIRGEAYWELCRERCARYGEGCCSAGIAIPPAHDRSHPHPPEECPRFEPL